MSHKNIVRLISLLLCALLLAGCGAAQEEMPAVTAEPSPMPTPGAETVKRPDAKIIVTEFMEKNKSVIADEDGDFSDWIELYNEGEETVSLKGWRISDNPAQKGWKFPDVSIAPGEYLLVFASNKEKDSLEPLHADFAISGDEGVYLKNPDGDIVFEALCGDCSGDVSMVRFADGSWGECMQPTPGYENTLAGHEAFQQSLAAAGPLLINEVMSFDNGVLWAGERGYCDWVEIKNVSDSAVQLSDYFLSDDDDDYGMYRLPRTELYPGQTYLVVCDDKQGYFPEVYPNSGFSLGSDGDQLYITDVDGRLSDFCSLPAVPYGCSYGRSSEGEAWFYMTEPSPGAENAEGFRNVAEKPASPTRDGVYEGVESVEVELVGSGTIRYTTDGSAPTEKSPVYTGPISLRETTVLRAVSFHEDAVPSLPLTLSFIINEGHSLPVLSLATDSPVEFRQMYEGMHKDLEKPGSLSLYRDGDSFTVGCGVSLNGQTSLILPKKNMSVRFRGAYGSAMLEHDIYGGGVTEFTNLLLRSGQDFNFSIIRNELAQSICELAGMKVFNQRSIYCVLYINGEYSGIYTLKEKTNEQLYASVTGVSRESVTVYEAPIPYGTDFYNDLVSFVNSNDMRLEENYEQVCTVIDMESLIDWIIIEGFCANTDLSYGNLRYAGSTEDDGKWRLMFYDLDAAFRYTGSIYYNLLTEYSAQNTQIGAIIHPLMENEQFRDAFLSRASELFATVLTNETIISEMERLAAEIAPEVARDYARFNMELSHWQWYLDNLRELVLDNNWRQCCIEALCELFELSVDERAHYFGEIDGK